MSPFWRLSRRLLHRPKALAAALVLAFVSAGGLGVGLLGIVPVLDNIVGEQGATLPDLIRKGVEKFSLPIPEGWITALPDGRFNAVLWLTIGLLGLTMLSSAAALLHSYFSLSVTTRAIADIRRDVFRTTLRLPLVNVGGRTNEIISRMMNDAEALHAGLFALTSKTVAEVSRGTAALTASFIINWRLSLAALVIGPPVFVVTRKIGKHVRRASRRSLQAKSELLGVSSEALQGLRIVKVFTAESRERGRFSRHNRRVAREILRAKLAKAAAAPITQSLIMIVMAGLAIVASKAIIENRMEMSDFVVTLGALAAAGSTLRPLTRTVHQVQTSQAAARRIVELLDREPESNRFGPSQRRRRPRLARHRRSIRFDDVSFTYPVADEPALRNINLTIEHGQTVAFVGPNGSGKTTLLAMPPRLIDPQAGRVLIDETDIAEVDLRSLRRQISVVTQETILFRGTVAENIGYGERSAPRERIVEAAKQACAHEFIERLPDGYDAPLDEGGRNLSGGQRQRLAIARAVLRDPAILILDEATSMIDADSERRIAEAVARFSLGRTCLIVAHRLSTVLGADRIVVMDRGEIIDAGSHDELFDRCETYRLLARTQLAPTPA